MKTQDIALQSCSISRTTAFERAKREAVQHQYPVGVFVVGPSRYVTSRLQDGDRETCHDSLLGIVNPDGGCLQCGIDW